MSGILPSWITTLVVFNFENLKETDHASDHYTNQTLLAWATRAHCHGDFSQWSFLVHFVICHMKTSFSSAALGRTAYLFMEHKMEKLKPGRKWNTWKSTKQLYCILQSSQTACHWLELNVPHMLVLLLLGSLLLKRIGFIRNHADGRSHMANPGPNPSNMCASM